MSRHFPRFHMVDGLAVNLADETAAKYTAFVVITQYVEENMILFQKQLYWPIEVIIFET